MLTRLSRHCWLFCCAAVALCGFHAWRSGVIDAWQRPSSRRSAVAGSGFPKAPIGRPAGAPARPVAVKQPPAAPARRVAVKRARAASARRPQPAPAVVYRKVVAAGVPMHVVQVDLRRPAVRVAIATARDGIGSREDWSAMIDRARPAAAITGTYFDVPSAIPVGSIVVGGKSVHRGLVGTAFAFAPAQGARLVACRPGQEYDWSIYETVLRAGPRLLTGGKATLWPGGEGFRDPAIFARKKRTAVALTRHGKLLLVAVEKPVLLRTLAQAMQSLDVVDAMCLDGGSSSGLYHHGKTRLKPHRPLTNLLVVYDSVARYNERVGSLVSAGVQIVAAPSQPAG